VFREDGPPAIEVVIEGLKRLLTSNFLTDETSDKAAVVDLVEFLVVGAVAEKLPNGTTGSETGAAKLSSINPKITLKSKWKMCGQ